jgi:hypothetical protein
MAVPKAQPTKAQSKLMGVPFGEDPTKLLASWLQSNDGLDIYELLSKKYR